MSYRVVVEPRADNDIEAAFLWIAARAPENDFFEIEIRQLFYGKRIGRYRILFTIERDNVHILHVRHGARRQLQEPSELEEDD